MPLPTIDDFERVARENTLLKKELEQTKQTISFLTKEERSRIVSVQIERAIIFEESRIKLISALQLMAEGKSRREASEIVGMNFRTIESNIDRVRLALDCISISHLMCVLMREGIIK